MVYRESFKRFLERAVELGIIDSNEMDIALGEYDAMIDLANHQHLKSDRDRTIIMANQNAISKINEILRKAAEKRHIERWI